MGNELLANCGGRAMDKEKAWGLNNQWAKERADRFLFGKTRVPNIARLSDAHSLILSGIDFGKLLCS